MSVATSAAIALGATAAAGVGSAAIGAHAAGKAADTQSDAARYAADLQNQQFQQQQANLQPWLQAGRGGLQQLSAGLQPGGAFAQQPYPQFQPSGAAQQALNPAGFTPTGAAQNALQPGTFQAPTAEQAAATPGYQFQFDQGLQALQRSQAATGALGGGAAKAAQQYGQGLASTNYQQAYGNALQAYNTNQGAAQTALAGQSGIYGQNLAAAQQALQGQAGLYGTNFQTQNLLQNQAFNRLADLAGLGQNATTQTNQASQNYANQAGNLLTSGAAAQAAGNIGQANAIAGGLGTIGNSAMNLYALNSIYGQPGATAKMPNAPDLSLTSPVGGYGVQNVGQYAGLPGAPGYTPGGGTPVLGSLSSYAGNYNLPGYIG